MYTYMKGTVTEIEPEKITLEVGGIGYHIVVPNPFAFQEDAATLVYIHHHVREDAHTLYGFSSIKEKRLFEQLLDVKGIGPKSALAVVAAADVAEIVRAIEMSDTKYLNRFPGIGPKASQQIVLDLKGRLQTDVLTIKGRKKVEELEDALRALGYKKKEIDRVVAELDTSKDTAVLIKEALRIIANR